MLKKTNAAAMEDESSLKVECSSHWNNWTAKYAFMNLPHGSIPGMSSLTNVLATNLTDKVPIFLQFWKVTFVFIHISF